MIPIRDGLNRFSKGKKQEGANIFKKQDSEKGKPQKRKNSHNARILAMRKRDEIPSLIPMLIAFEIDESKLSDSIVYALLSITENSDEFKHSEEFVIN